MCALFDYSIFLSSLVLLGAGVLRFNGISMIYITQWLFTTLRVIPSVFFSNSSVQERVSAVHFKFCVWSGLVCFAHIATQILFAFSEITTPDGSYWKTIGFWRVKEGEIALIAIDGVVFLYFLFVLLMSHLKWFQSPKYNTTSITNREYKWFCVPTKIEVLILLVASVGACAQPAFYSIPLFCLFVVGLGRICFTSNRSLTGQGHAGSVVFTRVFMVIFKVAVAILIIAAYIPELIFKQYKLADSWGWKAFSPSQLSVSMLSLYCLPYLLAVNHHDFDVNSSLELCESQKGIQVHYWTKFLFAWSHRAGDITCWIVALVWEVSFPAILSLPILLWSILTLTMYSCEKSDESQLERNIYLYIVIIIGQFQFITSYIVEVMRSVGALDGINIDVLAWIENSTGIKANFDHSIVAAMLLGQVMHSLFITNS